MLRNFYCETVLFYNTNAALLMAVWLCHVSPRCVW